MGAFVRQVNHNVVVIAFIFIALAYPFRFCSARSPRRLSRGYKSDEIIKRRAGAILPFQGDGKFHFVERDLDSDEVVGGNRGESNHVAVGLIAIPHTYLLGIVNILKSIFLPAGYPYTVPAEYTRYQIWNLVQDACSYLRGIMSTQAILTGMGVGRTDISTLQATVQWILRDGASMIGGLMFTSFSSANFGQNVKSWRLFADFINNLGITLDIIAPLTGKNFLTVVCVASICKALCGVAAGATNAVIAEHWGLKNNNMADVLAKNGAQHTIVNLLGLAVSVKFAQFVSASQQRIWDTYAVLTFVHMISNMMAMRILALRSLNIARYQMLVNRFLHTEPVALVVDNMASGYRTNKTFDSSMGKIREWSEISSDLAPAVIAGSEPIISLITPNPYRFFIDLVTALHVGLWKSLAMMMSRMGKMESLALRRTIMLLERALKPSTQTTSSMGRNIILWAPPSVISARFSANEITEAMNRYDRLNYFIIGADPNADAESSTVANRFSGEYTQLFVCFKQGCTAVDQAAAAFEASILETTRSFSAAREITKTVFPLFWEGLKKSDWDTSRLQLRPRVGRVFSTSPTKEQVAIAVTESAPSQ